MSGLAPGAAAMVDRIVNPPVRDIVSHSDRVAMELRRRGNSSHARTSGASRRGFARPATTEKSVIRDLLGAEQRRLTDIIRKRSAD